MSPDRFVESMSPEDRETFFALVTRRYVKLVILIAVLASIIISCAITIPTTLIINSNTNKIATKQSEMNCKGIISLKDVMKIIITHSMPGNHKTPDEIQFEKFSIGVINSVHCTT